MDDHPSGLVDHQHVVIFVSDVQRNGLGRYVTARRHWDVDDDGFAWARSVGCAFATSVNEHVAVRDQGRRVIPGQVQVRGNEDIEPGRIVATDERVPARGCGTFHLGDFAVAHWRRPRLGIASGRGVFTPENKSEENRPNRHRRIGHVERPEANIA